MDKAVQRDSNKERYEDDGDVESNAQSTASRQRELISKIRIGIEETCSEEWRAGISCKGGRVLFETKINTEGQQVTAGQ